MKSNNRIVKIISIVLIFTMLFSQFAFAGQFTWEMEEPAINDVFVYSDEWFSQPSTTVMNKHLKTLSLIASMASGTASSVKEFLNQIGFSDISLNAYLSSNTNETMSIGCTVASKTITIDERPYTLLAVLPRSFGYGDEWISNFIVGDSGEQKLHEGFEAARDQVLELMQQHVSNNSVSGDIKVWIAGHSRAAAVSNLLAGYLVDNPSSLGEGVNLINDDIYAYTFGTPQGARTSMAPHAEKYDCIRNYIEYSDPNTYIVPDDLGFTRYGQTFELIDKTEVSKDLMEMYLDSAYSYFRDAPLYGADPDDFEDASGLYKNQEDFLRSRFDMLEMAIMGWDNQKKMGRSRAEAFGKAYIEDGYQETCANLLSLIMNLPEDLSGLLPLLEENKALALETILSIFFGYAFDKHEAYDDLHPSFNLSNSVSVLLAQPYLIYMMLSMPELDMRDTIVGAIDDLLSGVELPFELTGDDVVDAIYSYSSKIAFDETSKVEAALKHKRYVVTHAAELAKENVQKLVSVLLETLGGKFAEKYAFLASETGSADLARLLGFLAFGTDVENAPILLISGSIFSSITINTDLPEFVTVSSFIKNFRSLGTAHVQCNMLSWLKADDHYYIHADLPEDSYEESQTVHLYTAKDSVIYYTTDGTDPTTASAVYNAESGVLLEDTGSKKEYQLKAVSALGEDISPVWTFNYAVGPNTFVPQPQPQPVSPSGGSEYSSGKKKDEPKEEPIPEMTDIEDGSYYSDAAMWALKNKITNGTSENTFSPLKECTRGELLTLLWRAAGSPKAGDADINFTDIVPDSYYAEAVAWACKNEITSGIGNNLFGADRICSRAEIVTMLFRYAKLTEKKIKGGKGSDSFTDVEADGWYDEAVGWAVNADVTKGFGESIFSPFVNCNRASAITFLYRYFAK